MKRAKAKAAKRPLKRKLKTFAEPVDFTLKVGKTGAVILDQSEYGAGIFLKVVDNEASVMVGLDAKGAIDLAGELLNLARNGLTA